MFNSLRSRHGVGKLPDAQRRAEMPRTKLKVTLVALPIEPIDRPGNGMTNAVQMPNVRGGIRFRNFFKKLALLAALLVPAHAAAAEPAAQTGVGGPFEAVQPLKNGDPQFKALFATWKKLDQAEQGSIAIPSAEPVAGSAFTSGFGVRSDPFRGRAAMHAGIDLAGPLGTPIYATADATVGRSEWAGGYGNLIELDHGRGIQTRYGHLSRSSVQAGQRVRRGQLIGYMGSTGRSTGSHLHYEVRIDGKAVNPVPFMQSNDYLASVQRRAAAATRVAMGGPQDAAK
jgi:murein DD-endopeptidase MepM/ murein hydrolase activator NlpD